ncbi:MAG: cytochrome c3 family protein [Anaeromyxobacter sp.]
MPLLVALAAGPSWAAADDPSNDDCLMCHADEQSATLAGGGELKLAPVDAAAYGGSVHGKAQQPVSCVQCHVGMTTEHSDGKPLPYKGTANLTRRHVEACKACHIQNFKKSLDGVHHRVAEAGNTSAPTCVDCHGSHAVAGPHERGRIAQLCAECHFEEAEAFAKSVHGRALDQKNEDVPVCTDCHRAHDTIDVRGGQMALRTADICGRCHSDEKLMKKYGLSPDVVSTYLNDFHGMSATLQRGRASREGGGRLAAGCTDCHGVHDIQKAGDPSSTVIAANLQKTCAKCHQGASASFPKAWLSHYQPTPEKAPLVWMVQLFYRLMIPFMVGGLLLQIALHLWRVVVNR